MTVSALLLGWLDPGLTSGEASLSVEKIEQMVHAAVTEGVRLRGQKWENVEFVPVSESSPKEGILAAETIDHSWHFHISANGYLIRGNPWVDQIPIDGNQPETIRIAVDKDSSSPGISQSQGECVRSLLAELSRQLPLSGRGLTVSSNRGS